MRYRLLGNSGLRVSELCLGTMTFGEDWGDMGANREESRRIFDAYCEAGGNFLDTANIYTNGTSEKFLGEFMGTERDRYVLATKYTLAGHNGDPNHAGNQRKSMMRSVEESLKRLNTDYIDLYYLHIWDELTPVDEIMRAFDDLVRSGKVLYVGISDTPAWEVSRMQMMAELRGWTRFVAYQGEYSLIERTPERDLLPMAKRLGMAYTAWSPLAAGILTGKYTRSKDDGPRRFDPDKTPRLNEKNLGIARKIDQIAEKMSIRSSQVALAWMRQNSSAIPIIGARNSTQIQDNLGCLGVRLDEEDMESLNQVSAIEYGFPHDFLNSEHPTVLRYAGMIDQIDR